MPDLKGIEAAVQPVLDQEAADLVDLQYIHEGGRWILRFYVDKAGGVTLDDCEHLSRRIEGILDMGNWIPQSYALEISSPGVDRILKRERDFRRFIGHRIKVRLKVPVEGRRNFSGFLKAFENGEIALESGDQTVRFGMDRIEEARLHPEVEI